MQRTVPALEIAFWQSLWLYDSVIPFFPRDARTCESAPYAPALLCSSHTSQTMNMHAHAVPGPHAAPNHQPMESSQDSALDAESNVQAMPPKPGPGNWSSLSDQIEAQCHVTTPSGPGSSSSLSDLIRELSCRFDTRLQQLGDEMQQVKRSAGLEAGLQALTSLLGLALAGASVPG